MKLFRAKLTFATTQGVIYVGQVFCLSEGDEIYLPPQCAESLLLEFYEEIDLESLFSGRGADLP